MAYNIDFFLHSFHDLGPFENEANKIAMIALFPTPYLSWCDVFDNLDTDYLLGEFTSGMAPVTGRLADYMKAYTRKRIEGYRKYRQLQLQAMQLPDTLIREAAIKPLLEHVLVGIAWARLDEKHTLIDANERYAELFGLTKKDLIEKRYNLIEDLTDESLKEQTKKQMDIKRKSLKPKFYFTKYKNPAKQESFPVTIYAFPIVNESDQYVGSFGVVTDVRGGA
jgi:PAS domain S-box-containing protein